MRNGMTPINDPLWLPLRGAQGSFPHSLLSTSKTNSRSQIQGPSAINHGLVHTGEAPFLQADCSPQCSLLK